MAEPSSEDPVAPKDGITGASMLGIFSPNLWEQTYRQSQRLSQPGSTDGYIHQASLWASAL